MQATEELKQTDNLPVQYSVSDSVIRELKTQYLGTTASTKEGYELCRVGIQTTRGLRGEVEKRRVELKADALAWGRKVDGEAKRLTNLLLEIEEPLKVEKAKIDDEKERIKRAAEEAERLQVETEAREKREAEEAALRAEREKLDAERKAMEEERAKQDAERQKFVAAQEAERNRQAAEQRKLDAEKERLERIEFERVAKEKAEKEARERVAMEQEEAAARKAKEEAETARLKAEREEQMPDIQKINEFGKWLGAIEIPDVKAAKALRFLDLVSMEISNLSLRCQEVVQL